MLQKMSIRLTFILAGLGVIAPTPSCAQEAKDMALVGTHDLQARSAYQPTIHLQSGRWIAYIGHHGGTQEVPKPLNPLTGAQESNGTSLLDVTIGVQRPDQIDLQRIKAALPVGRVTVKAVKGGLDVADPDNDDPAVIASAAVAVRADLSSAK